MARAITHLDCCRSPSLEVVRVVSGHPRDSQTVERCVTCQAHWFVRSLERVVAGEGLDTTTWWVRLTAAEASGRPDLEKLRDRAGFMEDLAGLIRIESMPW
ncbi:MAG TPA: hypothetical protein VGK67_36875 [Myxococcales bacterium]|jgi:hypothetical protein